MKKQKKVKNYVKKVQIIPFFLFILSNSFSQNKLKIDSANLTLQNSKDTLLVKGDDYVLYHYYFTAKLVQEKKVFENPENIFVDTLNDFSRLIFKSLRNGSFNIPTIPLTQIIYLKELGIIIGLSKIQSSPYHVVIYSEKGELLSKRILAVVELKFTKPELNALFVKYPKLINYIDKSIVVKDNDEYYIEPSNYLVRVIGVDSLLKMNKYVRNQFFPLMGISIDSRVPKYHSSFSDSDPLNDLILIGSVPYLLILNSEDGRKVNIPLISSVSFGCPNSVQ